MTPSLSSKVAADLQSALALLRTGQHPAAQKLLKEILATRPDLVDAHWMLAGSLYGTGDLRGAQQELEAVIRLDPNRAAAHAMLGQVLIALGRPDMAIQTLQRALELHADPTTATSLARALLIQARAPDAIEVLQPLVESTNATREALLLFGHALMSLGRARKAADVFHQLVSWSPEDGEARVRLAAALSDSDRHAEAEQQVRQGMAQGVRTPEARFVLGRALVGQKRLEEAEAEMRHVVRSRPEHIPAQANLSELVWMRSGNAEAAGQEIDAALASRPHLSGLRIAKANLLLAAGQPRQALEQVEEGIAKIRSPGRELLDLHVAAAQIALEFDAARSAAHARQALLQDRGDYRAFCAFGNALLATGEPAQAAEAAQALLKQDPHDGRAVALLASAWRMGGDSRYRELFDYENFVIARRIEVPRGWSTLSDYLADLTEVLGRMHSLKTHPVGQSLRRGSQVELDFGASAEPAIRAFAQAIDEPIREYMQSLGKGAGPLRDRNTGRYRLKGAWSVRLGPNGFHVNHFHPEGWLSSACYIKLPSAIGLGREGWLQFGEPAFPTAPALPPEHFIRPEPGLLALFPSYMWHGT
ncbi:MAG TPA: tetratricopeptide repeat protein, partial [Rhodanobacteraceae bacterium]|nr:tetratricopeptide repeat protein [Rhodanobacteraceae bacterium]